RSQHIEQVLLQAPVLWFPLVAHWGGRPVPVGRCFEHRSSDRARAGRQAAHTAPSVRHHAVPARSASTTDRPVQHAAARHRNTNDHGAHTTPTARSCRARNVAERPVPVLTTARATHQGRRAAVTSTATQRKHRSWCPQRTEGSAYYWSRPNG